MVADELTIDEIRKISASMDDILFLLLTGGDPFLREDLPEIVDIFVANNHIANLGIPSNGMNTAGIVSSVQRILSRHPGLDFGLDISIDGVGYKHDRIRGVTGLFDKAVATFNELKKLKRAHSNFTLNVAVTISAYNQDDLDELLDYLVNDLKPDAINHLLVRGEPRDAGAGLVDMDKYSEICSKLDGLVLKEALPGYKGFVFADLVNAMKMVRNQVIIQTAREQKRILPCYAARLSAVLDSTGRLYPCELLPDSMGNLRDVDYDFKRLWFSEKASKIRAKIDNGSCYCTYECFLTNSIMFNPLVIPRLLWIYAKLKASRL